MKDVKKAEIVYKTGDYETYYMPYYRFYAELPEKEQENGLKTYGCYYVPAVNGRYLEVVPSERGFLTSTPGSLTPAIFFANLLPCRKNSRFVLKSGFSGRTALTSPENFLILKNMKIREM